MRKLILPAMLALMTGLLAACGDGAPSEEEVKSRYSGLFCDGFYKTELKTDGTYSARRTPVAERCSGNYKFVHEKGVWKLVFEKSTDNSNQLVSCEGEQVIWEKEKGYISSDSLPEIKDLFEGKTLRKDNCE
jgi:hypothetical protein